MQQPQAQTHTLDTLRQALITHKPQLEPILATLFTKLARPNTPTHEIAEQLKTMLERDITPSEEAGARTFTWRNPSNQPIALTIPFQDDKGEAAAATEETEAWASKPIHTPESATEALDEAHAPNNNEPPANNPNDQDDEEQATPERERVNLLDELDVLLDNTHLHLILQRTGKKNGQNILSVTAIPQAKDDKTDPALLTPINLKGTARELEVGLLRAIRITVDGNDSIEQALAELEAAKKAAADGKKAEANKAKKTTSKATTKAAAKKEEKPAPTAAPKLFDAAPTDTKSGSKNNAESDATGDTDTPDETDD